MHLNGHSLARKSKAIDKLKVLVQSLHQEKIKVDDILLCKTFPYTEALNKCERIHD